MCIPRRSQTPCMPFSIQRAPEHRVFPAAQVFLVASISRLPYPIVNSDHQANIMPLVTTLKYPDITNSYMAVYHICKNSCSPGKNFCYFL
ncbi:hypothetical protein SCFA_30052 [anaerobic digester metagenome]|uniref:Uncharacterized protein n=1 Tax=anaerobic digester metagenome TaxID=1263854 RepID=A0A485LZF9_9ZZZZ